MRILVCGGRAYHDRDWVFNVLDTVHSMYKVTCVIQGGARGADSLGQRWAEANRIPCQQFDADWDTHGRAAGFIRNEEMLTKGRPNMVVAFPGGPGTRNMIKLASNSNRTELLIPGHAPINKT